MQVNSTNVTVGDVNQILLSLGGVIQKPGTDFTVSSSTLTFTTAPAANTSFFAILLGSDNGGTVTPTDGSVTGDKVASSGAFTIGAAGTASSLAGIPFFQGDTGSIYTHDVSGTDSTAQYNTAYGLTALDAVTTADKSTMIGYAAGSAITTGGRNTAVGYQAMDAATEGEYNQAFGHGALGSLTTGSSNIGIGDGAADGFDTESQNVAIGLDALGGSVAGGEYNVAVGNNTFDALTSGDYNVAIGHNAGTDHTTGGSCVYIGANAGANQTTASGDIYIGSSAGTTTVTTTTDAGNPNTFVGYTAGYSITGEIANTFIGRVADGTGTPNGCEYNVGIGNYVFQDLTTGDNNTAVGYNSMPNTTTAPSSTAVGYAALRDQTTGGGSGNGYNIGIGAFGMANVTTGSFNIGIGGFAYASATNSTSQIVMGYNVAGSGNSTFTFGGGSSDTTCSFGATSFSAPSDERWKKDIETSTCGLSFINDLRPVSFKFKTKGELDSSLNDYEKDSTEVAGFTSDSVLGFVAQEVKTVIDNHSEFKGSELWKEGLERHNERQRISKEALIPIMVKAIQELSEEVKKLKEA